MVMTSYETFKYRGQTWTRYPAPARRSLHMGVDLGQSQDPTAIMCYHTPTPLETWTVNEDARTTRQDVEEHFDVVSSRSAQARHRYPDVVAHVGRSSAGRRCAMAAIWSLTRAASAALSATCSMPPACAPVRVSITAGTDATTQDGRRWSVTKSLLISGVDARLHSGELSFAAELARSACLSEELKDFRSTSTSAGRATYQARVGKHDDLVLAVAIALWWAIERRKYRIIVGPLLGLY